MVIDKSPQSDREVADAIRGIMALRKLTKETRFQTGRSQSAILKTLSEEQLADLPEFKSMAQRISTLDGKYTVSRTPDKLLQWHFVVPIESAEH